MMMMMMMEDAIKIERSMEKEIKLDVNLPLTEENFMETENQQQQQKWETSAIRRDSDNNIAGNTTNTNRQLQEPEMPLMQHNSTNNNHKNIKKASKRATMAAVGTRCGEIFVTNNARKWTFVCTYCNKSTRDIGAFILHLKKMHLNDTYSDTASEAEDNDALSCDEQHTDERACNTSGQEQDVRKCNKQKKILLEHKFSEYLKNNNKL